MDLDPAACTRFLLFALQLCGPGGCWTGFKPLSANEWYYVAAVVGEDDSLRFYVNGEPDGPVFRTAGATSPNTLDLAIGRSSSGGANWHGALDEVSLWSVRELPAFFSLSIRLSLSLFSANGQLSQAEL